MAFGEYADAGSQYHGFTFDGSDYTTFDIPGATIIEVMSGSGGNVVGTYFDAANQMHGFVFNGTSVAC